MKIVTVSQAAAMDSKAEGEYALPQLILMENAAGAACRLIRQKLVIEETNFLVLCGSGNNGGDGLALARLLYSAGGAPLVLMTSSPEKLSGPARQNYEILKNYPIEILLQFSEERLRKELEETDVVIDALLGTGLSREIGGSLARYIELINESEKKVFSIDIPTGINGDTGQVMGSAIQAAHTISFGALKPGNFLYPGYGFNGEVSLSRISLPPEIYDSGEFSIELNDYPPLPVREETGHKKSFGNILTISGAANYFGAPVFAAAGVLKSGGGFSRLASPASIIPYLAAQLPEAVFLPMEETDQRSISPSNLNILLKEADKSDGVVIGPGMSLNSRTAELICSFIRAFEGFTVVDGDALSAVAGKYHLFENRRGATVLTPHTGEMARLCATTVEEIRKDPVKIVRRCAGDYHAIAVLKGPHSLIGFPDGRVIINTSGNSGLGTAGSGDILAGMIAGLFGAGLDGEDAVKAGVFLHGFAGDIAADKLGKDSLTARDILEAVPPAVKRYRENYDASIGFYRDLVSEV
ncbi:NAD(P)H-hydrate dehydratase [Spirochaeta isovalerica]|uniref:Bifunctional NAD(P)H-hydrate repair enzyme n=1 Tax=Spirochaeta isovalerica TaxID=150 RepID=A0A841RGF1_9SPIO|nr:NAD(P)H-hydrate dehydratase [Spirochaeta isovalerica]MBB6482090.1 NAD(P)H-hydrate epimerase [Spirochaeta isovalerica]